ncbi:cysteine rich repeat-containing protein [Roseibium salinum]|uniref:Cysteine rich repeat-containing protein n=1 Tax=Roseibium salinum TaxID=1604349 RepID=A0ABT3QXU8_9HYPH|nr:cysteine rich repeat-containing protein [Roseibium sp. DSM 29163]MCX2721742.1 cysteine rich repeat-containing protein [Roseibium sp. DSM 29163]
MFSHRFAKLTAIAITGFLLSVLGSASPQAQGVLEDCASDITTYCAEVEPGHGRVLSCLYAYEDKISEACYAATIDFHDVMDFMFASVRDALASCAGDIDKHCSGTEFGHGRILTCLSETKAEIAPACKQVVNGFEQGLAASE